jgi:hypothetical protein
MTLWGRSSPSSKGHSTNSPATGSWFSSMTPCRSRTPRSVAVNGGGDAGNGGRVDCQLAPTSPTAGVRCRHCPRLCQHSVRSALPTAPGTRRSARYAISPPGSALKRQHRSKSRRAYAQRADPTGSGPQRAAISHPTGSPRDRRRSTERLRAWQFGSPCRKYRKWGISARTAWLYE